VKKIPVKRRAVVVPDLPIFVGQFSLVLDAKAAH
jgi:hypothetical protein